MAHFRRRNIHLSQIFLNSEFLISYFLNNAAIGFDHTSSYSSLRVKMIFSMATFLLIPGLAQQINKKHFHQLNDEGVLLLKNEKNDPV